MMTGGGGSPLRPLVPLHHMSPIKKSKPLLPPLSRNRLHDSFATTPESSFLPKRDPYLNYSNSGINILPLHLCSYDLVDDYNRDERSQSLTFLIVSGDGISKAVIKIRKPNVPHSQKYEDLNDNSRSMQKDREKQSSFHKLQSQVVGSAGGGNSLNGAIITGHNRKNSLDQDYQLNKDMPVFTNQYINI
jgi:hypothetical protein